LVRRAWKTRAAWPDVDDVVGVGVAAFAQALHDTLAVQMPSQQASLDASLAATLASVPDCPARKSGIAAGAHEASVILAERAGDGLDTASVDIPWTPPPPAPGVFQLTPPVSRPAIPAGQGNARPFLLKRNDQFDPGPPLRIDSPKYHRALAEVEYIGATNSPRTGPWIGHGIGRRRRFRHDYPPEVSLRDRSRPAPSLAADRPE
jgi:hypothetical protein